MNTNKFTKEQRQERQEMFEWLSDFAYSEIAGNHHAFLAACEIRTLISEMNQILQLSSMDEIHYIANKYRTTKDE